MEIWYKNIKSCISNLNDFSNWCSVLSSGFISLVLVLQQNQKENGRCLLNELQIDFMLK